MGYEVSVDGEECVSAGKCIASAPGFFVFDHDEIAAVDPACPSPDDQTLLRIARSCPSGAVRLSNDGEPIDL